MQRNFFARRLIRSNFCGAQLNTDIANIFFRAGLIESWGRGIEKIVQSSQKYNGTSPIFSFNNGLNVEFKSKYPGKDYDNQQKELIEGGAPIGGPIILTTRQKEILDIIKRDNKISYRALAVKLKINNSAVKKHLNILQRKGALKRVGKTRGYWQVEI